MFLKKNLFLITGLLGFIGVSAGAFGAHFLKSHLSSEMAEIYKTGVFYLLFHTSVLAAIAISGKERFRFTSAFFIAGIVLFSFSLFIYSVTSVKIFAMITPVGGFSFLIGWIMLIKEGISKNIND